MKEKLLALWHWMVENKTIWFALFIIVYALAWTANALVETKFVLREWEDMGKYILGKYGTDSLVNTTIPAIDQLKGRKENV
jgi:hypothetical protein